MQENLFASAGLVFGKVQPHIDHAIEFADLFKLR
jgi:hypothetical protein